ILPTVLPRVPLSVHGGMSVDTEYPPSCPTVTVSPVAGSFRLAALAREQSNRNTAPNSSAENPGRLALHLFIQASSVLPESLNQRNIKMPVLSRRQPACSLKAIKPRAKRGILLPGPSNRWPLYNLLT